MIYCQAILPRAGLGNRLFAWARCCIFSHLRHIPMLAPSWFQVRPGALLRRELDPKFYHNLFTRRPDHIGGVRKLWLQLRGRHVPEPLSYTDPIESFGDRPTIVTFRGLKDFFGTLNG